MKLIKIILPLVALFVLQTAGNAQYIEYKAIESSKLWFDGTSTLHDFTCHAKEINANVIFSPSLLDGNAGETQAGQVTIPVKKIKNENDGLTKNMYKTLQPEKWPEITFDLNTIVVPDTQKIDKTIQVEVKGDLTIKGETREISFPVKVNGIENADTLQVKGHYLLSLANFDIKRPSFFLGTLKVGDEIDIQFELAFVQADHYKELTKR